MNEYREAFESFNSQFSDGLTLPAHSGINGQPETTIYSAKDYFDYDETSANESFHNFLDSESLELLISLDDCFNNCISDILESQILDSFINGQKKQAINQLENLFHPSDFLDFIEDHDLELKILRLLAMENC